MTGKTSHLLPILVKHWKVLVRTFFFFVEVVYINFTGTSAYAGAAKDITLKDVLTAAGTILATEARHASWVASAVNGKPPWSGSFEVSLHFEAHIFRLIYLFCRLLFSVP